MGSCLGRGGFGEVYRATMRSSGGLDTDVAVKVLRSDLDLQTDAVRRLRDEGRLLARLNHPTILRVHDLVVLDGRVSLVTEYVEGADLCDCPDIPLRALVQVLGAVAEALDAAWGAEGPDGRPLELVHRDVKPTNIRLGRHGEVKLLDFGIARSDAMDREARTDSNLVVGSLPYMAPERFLEKAARAESDVMGLGCVAYEMLAGERFYGKAVMRDVSALALDRGRYDAFSAERLRALPALPDAVASLVREMLAYEPSRRPTAQDLATRCERVADALDGPSLKAWARGREWPSPSAASGQLEGRVLTEGTLNLPDPGPPGAPVVQHAPTATREPVRPVPMPVLSLQPSVQDRGFTEDAVVRPARRATPSPPSRSAAPSAPSIQRAATPTLDTPAAPRPGETPGPTGGARPVHKAPPTALVSITPVSRRPSVPAAASSSSGRWLVLALVLVGLVALVALVGGGTALGVVVALFGR